LAIAAVVVVVFVVVVALVVAVAVAVAVVVVVDCGENTSTTSTGASTFHVPNPPFCSNARERVSERERERTLATSERRLSVSSSSGFVENEVCIAGGDVAGSPPLLKDLQKEIERGCVCHVVQDGSVVLSLSLSLYTSHLLRLPPGDRCRTESPTAFPPLNTAVLFCNCEDQQ